MILWKNDCADKYTVYEYNFLFNVELIHHHMKMLKENLKKNYQLKRVNYTSACRICQPVPFIPVNKNIIKLLFSHT